MTRPKRLAKRSLPYDPAELEEKAELPLERKKEILERFHRADEVDHYEALEVPRDAEKKDIRAAYFRLSKQFHPDTLYGKELGSFKQKMERVFKRLTEAYEVLGKNKRRRQYDEYLALKDRTSAIRMGLEQGEAAAERVASESQPPAAPEPEDGPAADPSPEASGAAPADRAETSGAESAPGAKPSAAPSGADAEARRQRARQLLERRLRSATGHRRPPSAPGASKEPPLAPAASKQQVLRKLTGSLRQAAALTGGASRFEAYVRAAEQAAEKGDLVTAVNSFRLALAMEDGHEDVR
ncbi:MAG: DnaJ domain-containing protein, partial [Myxococcota bacterium]